LGDGRQYLVPNLALVGIVEDVHLQVFSKWSGPDRRFFLDTFLKTISPLDRETLSDILIYPAQFIRALKSKAEENKKRNEKMQFSEIVSAPTSTLMETLSDPDTSLHMLMTPMDLNGNHAPAFYHLVVSG
jgi:hypothetical protein